MSFAADQRPLSGLPPEIGLPVFEPGTVWLTGAGPGDPGLLTLHAVNALAQADVIVYDALVGEEVLRFARAGAVLEFMGKRGGRVSPRQTEISARLVDLAVAGKRVLRLKGGDPFMFGRGGEEAGALVAAGIRFRIIPGVTAGLGGIAYAGIPATHRDVNQVVTFLTGHMAGGDMTDGVDWEAVAKGSPVLVLYMAMRHLERIAARLMAAGRAPDTPVAIVSRATMPDQAVLETTLEAAGADLGAADLDGPSIIVVGEAVRLRKELDWLAALAPEADSAGPVRASL